jgi:hypothetical protein
MTFSNIIFAFEKLPQVSQACRLTPQMRHFTAEMYRLWAFYNYSQPRQLVISADFCSEKLFKIEENKYI